MASLTLSMFTMLNAAIMVNPETPSILNTNSNSTPNVLLDDGNDVVLIVAYGTNNGASHSVTASLNGGSAQAMTLLGGVNAPSGSDFNGIFAIELGNLTGGSNEVDLVFSGNTARSTASILQLTGATLNNYDQADQFRSDGNSGPGTFSTSFTSVEEDSVVVHFLWSDTAGTSVTSAFTNVDFDSTFGGTNRSGGNAAYNTGLAAGAYSTSITVTSGGGDSHSLTSVNIYAIPEPGTFALVGISGLCALLAVRRRKH